MCTMALIGGSCCCYMLMTQAGQRVLLVATYPSQLCSAGCTMLHSQHKLPSILNILT